MPKLIGTPTPVPASGNKTRYVDEYVGLINTGDTGISIAHSRTPAGWEEPAQCPKFDRFTIVLKGMVRVEHADGAIEAEAGQAIHVTRDEWVRYSTPGEAGAEYVTVCMPAYSRADIRWED